MTPWDKDSFMKTEAVWMVTRAACRLAPKCHCGSTWWSKVVVLETSRSAGCSSTTVNAGKSSVHKTHDSVWCWFQQSVFLCWSLLLTYYFCVQVVEQSARVSYKWCPLATTTTVFFFSLGRTWNIFTTPRMQIVLRLCQRTAYWSSNVHLSMFMSNKT